jgi:serine/threonine-protein kinase
MLPDGESEPMKLCPQCKTGFPDHVETCPTHGVFLSEILDLKPGMSILNKYRIVRKLGEGGFGAVYLADQTLMDEQRALKFLARQWSRDQGSIARFRREVQTLRQVRHKNVVDCGDLEQAEDDSLFFAMEFVDGPDLRDFLHSASRPFEVKAALEIARGIAEGMGAAHAKGMVHRDIKPENLLMARDAGGWVPKIADFGIVATKESSTGRTSTGGSLLTWAYAAPEQWRGMRGSEMDGRTDLYALGGVLFEMLTGKTVFDAENYEGWAFEHGNTPPRPPSSLRPDLANWPGLDALVLSLLAKNRDDRPKDVPEFLVQLDAIEYAPAPRRVTVRQEAEPEPVARTAPKDPPPPISSNPKPALPVARVAERHGEQFDPKKHIRLTKGLWLKRVPPWKAALTLLAILATLVAGGFLTYLYLNNDQSGRGTEPAAQSFNWASPVGTLAPDFTVSDGTNTIHLADYRGRVVVLNFWASWAPECQLELLYLQELHQDQPALAVLAVDVDESPRAYKRFVQANHLTLTTVGDPGETAAKLFHTDKWPETYVIDRQGVVRRKLVGIQDWSSAEIREFLKSL